MLTDEPSAKLVAENAEFAFNLIQRLNSGRGTTFVIVTHDPELAARMDQTYDLQDGVFS